MGAQASTIAMPVGCSPWRTSVFAAMSFLAVGVPIQPAFCAGTGAVQILKAWVPSSEQTGNDVPFLMTIKNDAASPDALLRVKCPVANFNEKHVVDRGEGAPAMRSIRSIPIPANKTVELKPDGYHVMLLQTRQKLVEGETFTCTVTFQNAGLVETEVHVQRTP